MQKQKCEVPTCNKPREIRDWCDTHYCRWKRYGDVSADKPIQGRFTGDTPEGQKWCPACRQFLLLLEFITDNGVVVGWCHECRFDKNLQRMYCMSRTQYESMLTEQKNLCASCREPETTVLRNQKIRRLAVDHDHACCAGAKSCGRCVRGLLCSRCNRVAGLMNDNTTHLTALTDYIVRNQDRLETHDGSHVQAQDFD